MKPASFSATEIASPMPRVPPVTTATRAMNSSFFARSQLGADFLAFQQRMMLRCNAVIPGEQRIADAVRGKGTQAPATVTVSNTWVPFPRVALTRAARRG